MAVQRSDDSREIAPGVHWVQENGPDRSDFVAGGPLPEWYDPEQSLHIAQNAYVIDDERSLLFDTLSPASTDCVLEATDRLLDDGLDYVVVSHPDVPHAGNAPALLREYPEAELVAPRYGDTHELYHLEDALQVGAGDSLDLGEHTVAFHEATFPDASLHMWMTEEKTDTFFPVDWLGYPHMERESLLFADEFDAPLTVDRLVQFHGRVLFWFQYLDVPKLGREVDRLVEEFDPAMVAPAHGNPVREDTREFMSMTKATAERVDEQGRVGTLG